MLAELERLSPAGFRRLDDLGLLQALGGSTARLGHLGPDPSSELLRVAALGQGLEELPITRELARMTRTLLNAVPPAGDDPRRIHRFRSATEPGHSTPLHYLGATASVDGGACGSRSDPGAPLLKGDELGVPPGPESRPTPRAHRRKSGRRVRSRPRGDALQLVAGPTDMSLDDRNPRTFRRQRRGAGGPGREADRGPSLPCG